MKSFMRKIVAGPKKKTPFNGQDLDLTYITGRIIAMAYPASNFLEKQIRNSIDDVAQYFNEYHPNAYLIINVSCRPYDYAKFDNRVLEYEWPDHQAPPITTLFDIAAKTHSYLKSVKGGVVAIHCNHGKGRTGTAIIAVLLYLGYYKTAKEVLEFYNSRRFSSETYGVDQPCQTRYLHFVEQLLTLKEIPNKLIAYRLSGVSQQGLHDKHYVSIKHVRKGQTLVEKFNFAFISKLSGLPLIGDLFIEIFEEGWASGKRIARVNYNSFFINPTTELSIKSLQKDTISLVLQSSAMKCSKSLANKTFSITLTFEYFCLCHLEESLDMECECRAYRVNEEFLWNKMRKQCEQAHNIWKEDEQYFFSQEVDVEGLKEEEEGKAEEEHHQIYPLSKNFSNLEEGGEKGVIGVIKDGPECKLTEDHLDESEEQGEEGIRQRRTQAFDLEHLMRCSKKQQQE